MSVGSGSSAVVLQHAANPFTYTGRYNHASIGLMYFRARYYDPNTGEFISRDPLEYVDGMSLYRGYFVPRRMDPFSLCEELLDCQGNFEEELRRIERDKAAAIRRALAALDVSLNLTLEFLENEYDTEIQTAEESNNRAIQSCRDSYPNSAFLRSVCIQLAEIANDIYTSALLNAYRFVVAGAFIEDTLARARVHATAGVAATVAEGLAVAELAACSLENSQIEYRNSQDPSCCNIPPRIPPFDDGLEGAPDPIDRFLP